MFHRSGWITSLALALFVLALPSRAQTNTLPPNTLAMKTDLLVVTAHPDDESMMAATMARYADQGKVVSLVIATHGEGGGNSTGKESGVSLGIVREAELRRCLGILGVRYLYSLHQPDWAYTESVQATLARWGHDESLRRLVRLVRILRPEVIATMDPAPVGGQHGHHQAAGRLATEAFEVAANPRAFPELQHDEGLAPWRVRKLYWVAFGGRGTVSLATDTAATGGLAATSPGKTYAEIAMDAERNHRSQGFDRFMEMAARSGQRPPARPEGFLLVKSRVATNPTTEKDLFDGITGANGTSAASDVRVEMAPSPPTASLEVALQPEQPVRNYRAWLEANGISRLMTRLPAHIPVTIGAASPVVVEVRNRGVATRRGVVRLELPAGWKVDTAQKSAAAAPGKITTVTFRVTPPAGATQGSQPVKAHWLSEGVSLVGDGQLDALPQIGVTRLPRSLPVDAAVAKWTGAGIVPIAIPPSHAAQGTVKGQEECSGRFFVGYDNDGIQVLVDVKDDTVVSNIAPDDIKAHWRSTSTEICIDPNPRAENTFGTLKLGIFPRDTSGRVRAARDADANPGPVDEKEKGIRLASKLQPGGYIIEARIPWAALRAKGFQPIRNRTLGFNVILYHAGKKEARIGEDINKSRLAWSFWPGVWGRPNVWGTAVLK